MISFIFDKTHSFDFEKKNIAHWLNEVISREGKKTGDIQYSFCNDEGLLKINQNFLKHDTYTDIISFPLSINPKIISGEIYISIDRVRSNSARYNISFDDELYRVMVHGILHFLGYNDSTTKEKELMRSKEDYYLNLRTQLN